MEWLLLLMLSVASVTEIFGNEDPQTLAERIVETEEECDSLQSLARNNNIYITLKTICEESLNEDKYAYVELSKIDLAKYKSESKFPVKIGHKEEWVKIPPHLNSKEMKEKLKGLKGKKTILAYKSNKRGQKIIYKQIKCELNKDEGCFRQLNCMKYKLMDDLELDLKLNKDYFPISYKGKTTNINSPPEADDVDALCKEMKDEEEDDDFGELDALKILPLKLKKGGTKMVTKSLVGEQLTGLLGKAALATITNRALGEDSKPSFAGKLMTLLAPNLGGFMASSIIGGNKKSPFSLVGREHINTIMIFITNKMKKKEDRVRLRKAEVKVAVEVVTKTFLHFLILSIRLKKGLTSDVVPKRMNSFVETIKMTVIDSVAAYVVNFVIDQLMPEDDGVAQSGGQFRGFIDKIVTSKSAKHSRPPPPPPPKKYSSGELFDDDDDGEE